MTTALLESVEGRDLIFWFGFYGPFKNISLISSRSFIEGGRKLENPEKNHLTIRKQNLECHCRKYSMIKSPWKSVAGLATSWLLVGCVSNSAAEAGWYKTVRGVALIRHPDGRTNWRTDRWTDEPMETCMPKSPKLKQVQQKSEKKFFFLLVFCKKNMHIFRPWLKHM